MAEAVSWSLPKYEAELVDQRIVTLLGLILRVASAYRPLGPMSTASTLETAAEREAAALNRQVLDVARSSKSIRDSAGS